MSILTFKVEAIEDLKIGQANRQIDNEYAMDYIPGSALRGALIARYLQKYPHVDLTQDEKSRAIFLSGGAKFYNSYLSIKNQRSMPIPPSFYADKDALKKWDRKTVFTQIINDMEEDVVLEGYKKFKPATFMYYDQVNHKAYFKSVKKVNYVHIAKDLKKNKIFRYEAIKKGEVFEGMIEVQPEYAKELMSLLIDGIVYIGGSKGTGYGKCKITQVCQQERNSEQDFSEMNSKTFLLYAESDILYCNSYGEVKGFIETVELKEKLGLEEVVLEKSSIETVVISGYNVKWGSRMPQYIGIGVGSIFKYSYKGNLEKEKVEALVREGIGKRKAEGYGQIRILNRLTIETFEQEVGQSLNTHPLLKLKPHEEPVLQNILNHLQHLKLQQGMEKYIVNTFLDWTPQEHKAHNPLSNILEVLNMMALMSKAEGLAFFENYIHHEAQKNTETKLINQLKQIKVGQKHFLDYIESTIKEATHPDILLQRFVGGKTFQLEGYRATLTHEMAYQYTIEYLSKLITYMLRKSAKMRRQKG